MGKYQLRDIEAAVCFRFGTDLDELRSPRRSRTYTRPRYYIFLLAREFTSLSLPQIGNRYDRDHTTVMHGIKRIKELYPLSPRVRRHVSEICGILENSPTAREQMRASVQKGEF